jgi:hypothetical protein
MEMLLNAFYISELVKLNCQNHVPHVLYSEPVYTRVASLSWEVDSRSARKGILILLYNL